MRIKSIDLENIAAGLDISPYLHNYAVDRYNGIASFLEKKGIKATFYSQGSFRTGTVVRPIRDGAEADFDLDVICELSVKKTEITEYHVKHDVGVALKSDETYNKKLQPEDDICWTLQYADPQDGIGFNLDIVPSVADEERVISLLKNRIEYRYAEGAISVTERKASTVYEWLASNPSGFGRWFDDINRKYIDHDRQTQREKVFKQYRDIFQMDATVEDVPDYYLRSSLQRIIQLLKRHRDIYFGRIPEGKKYCPKSVIITSLVARIAAQTEPQGLEFLLKYVVQELYEYAVLLEGKTPMSKRTGNPLQHIAKDNDTWIIQNPVDPEDNYADDWTDKNARAFFEWVRVVKHDLADTMTINEQAYLIGLQTSFGMDYVNRRLNLLSECPEYKPPMTIHAPTKPWGMRYERNHGTSCRTTGCVSLLKGRRNR